MELRVGIVEDEKQNQDELICLLNTWGKSVRCTVQFDIFLSGESVTDGKNKDYHVVFMDIKLPRMNGVEAAKKLRRLGYSGEIIFLTAFRDYVFDAFDVRAFQFLTKPISHEDLCKCMNRILRSVQDQYYILKKRDEITRIPYHDMVYILSNHHQMIFVTAEGSYSQLIRIKDLLQKLPSQFVQCHRTVILNSEHIQKLVGNNAYMSNREIQPISERYLQAVRDKFESNVI